MQKNAEQVNKLNMEQERLLDMLNKVRDTNFRKVPSGLWFRCDTDALGVLQYKRSDPNIASPGARDKDDFAKFQQSTL